VVIIRPPVQQNAISAIGQNLMRLTLYTRYKCTLSL